MDFVTALKKGKKAEKIVGDLFKEAGFEVINYGYEYTTPQLTDRGKGNALVGKAGEYIRHQPDFVIINDRNEAFFVEVKHRSKKLIPDKEIFPYPNCYVVLLTKQNILAQSTYWLFSKKVGFQPLTKMPPFSSIPDKLVSKYVKKLKRVLGDETLTGQFVENYIQKFTGKKLQQPIDEVEIVMEKKTKRKTGYKPKKKTTKKSWGYKKRGYRKRRYY